jgi:hypothetical protein
MNGTIESRGPKKHAFLLILTVLCKCFICKTPLQGPLREVSSLRGVGEHVEFQGPLLGSFMIVFDFGDQMELGKRARVIPGEKEHDRKTYPYFPMV